MALQKFPKDHSDRANLSPHPQEEEATLLSCQLAFLAEASKICKLILLQVGPKKYQKIARMYNRTGLSTKCTLIKTGFKNARTGTKAKFGPFVDALVQSDATHKNPKGA